MESIKVSELENTKQINENDLLMIIQDKKNKNIKVSDFLSNNIIELLTVSSIAPTECNIGDKYYNTTTSKIYTATATNTWARTGENPSNLYLYVDLEHKELYYFDGTRFVSYGGGSGGTGGDTLPIGAILPFSSDTIPNGWLLCDGSVIEQEDYPELFEVLAGNYGIISREEIRLPDLRGKVTVGKDSTDADFDTLGNTGGEKTHTLTVNEMPKHSHNFQFDQTEGSNITAVKVGTNNTYGKATSETGGDQPHNNLQPYIVTNYIIKAKMTIVTNGEVIQQNGIPSTDNVYSAKAIDNKLKTSVKVEESGDGYTKYSDGTMVCYGTASVTNPSFSDWYGFCRLANATTINLVKAFKDNNYSLTITSETFGYFTAMITSKTVSSFTFRAFTHNNTAYNPGNGTFDYIAIGKWK